MTRYASEHAAADGEGQYQGFFDTSRGIAAYRVGRFAEASKLLATTTDHQSVYVRSLSLPFYAMSERARGNRQMADTLAERARSTARTLPEPGTDEYGVEWTDILISRKALEEMETASASNRPTASRNIPTGRGSSRRRSSLMLAYLEQMLLVLAIGSAVAISAKRLNVPYNVALVVVGLLLVLMNVLPETPMDPHVVLMVFLPVLVFEGALSADAESHAAGGPADPDAGRCRASRCRSSAPPPSPPWVIGFPFAVALLLGAVLAITDTVSVLLAFRSVRVPHRLAAIMEGESLFNDGTALVLVSVATTVVMQGFVDPALIARMLVVATVVGALLGTAFGTLAATGSQTHAR